MSGFANPIKFGPPGKEISFTGDDQVTGFAMRIGPVRQDSRNLIREQSSSVLRRHGTEFAMSLQGVSEETVLALASISGLRDQELALVFADDWQINSEQYNLDASGETFTMKSNSFLLLDRAYASLASPLARQVNLVGVYDDLELKGDHSASNRIATAEEDSLNRDSWLVELDTPGSANGRVFVDYTIKGALVYLSKDIQITHSGFYGADGGLRYDIRLDLTGI